MNALNGYKKVIWCWLKIPAFFELMRKILSNTSESLSVLMRTYILLKFPHQAGCIVKRRYGPS